MIVPHLFNFIYEFVLLYTPLVSFLGTFFFGGETAALLSFGAAQGFYKIIYVFIFGFLGIVSADILWFMIGKYSSLSFLKRHHFFNVSSEKATKLLHVLYRKRFRLLFFSRFIYGTSIMTLLYLGKRMEVSKFILYEVLISISWILFYGGIGWYAGKGIRLLVVLYNNLYLMGIAFLFLLLLFVFVRFFIGPLLFKFAKEE